MEKVSVTSLRWTLLSVCFFGFISAEQEVIQVNFTVGDTAILPCKAPESNNITVVEWSRPDLEPECVFLCRNGKIKVEDQNPVFKERAELQDGQMKDGDVSLEIKNVTTEDDGTYECRVQTKTERGVDPISNITLRVVDPPGPGGTTEDGGKEGGSVGLMVSQFLLCFLLLLLLVF